MIFPFLIATNVLNFVVAVLFVLTANRRLDRIEKN